jgi:hypothetical protein
VDNIDPFEGGLAEDHVAGSDVGPLFQAIMVDQFTQIRDGDRFFYLNESFNRDENAILNGSNTLAEVIEANTNVTNLQKNAFKFKASINGTVFLDQDGDGGSQQSNEPGLRGVTVQLQDAAGNVLATTVTNRDGHYKFNQLSGPAANPDIAYGVSATGNYNIVLLLSASQSQTTPNPSPILISAGSTHVDGVNFGVKITSSGRLSSATARSANVLLNQTPATFGNGAVSQPQVPTALGHHAVPVNLVLSSSANTIRPAESGGAILSGGPVGAARLVVSASTFDHNQAIGGNGNQSPNAAPNVADSDTTGACGLHTAVEVGRVSNPSYQEAGRDLFFGLTGTADLPLGSRQHPGENGAPSRMSSAGPVDAVFAAVSERPIFAVSAHRGSDDSQFDVPVFPDLDAFESTRIDDFMPAESMG